jgi:hypothetical protein
MGNRQFYIELSLALVILCTGGSFENSAPHRSVQVLAMTVPIKIALRLKASKNRLVRFLGSWET